MRALRRFSVIALIAVTFALRYVAAGELPTAKPGEVGLDADRACREEPLSHQAENALRRWRAGRHGP